LPCLFWRSLGSVAAFLAGFAFPDCFMRLKNSATCGLGEDGWAIAHTPADPDCSASQAKILHGSEVPRNQKTAGAMESIISGVCCGKLGSAAISLTCGGHP
jgi:hypothetical protein